MLNPAWNWVIITKIIEGYPTGIRGNRLLVRLTPVALKRYATNVVDFCGQSLRRYHHYSIMRLVKRRDWLEIKGRSSLITY